MLDYILWNADPEIFKLGSFVVRWYGLLFALGFLVAQQIMIYIFKRDGKPEKDVESLTLYMILATVIGARLGHCLFYEPAYYLSNPIDILKVWEGGLASHGATIGIITGLYLFARNKKGYSFLWIIDRIVIVVAFVGMCIRLGNFINSEIIGKPIDSQQGVVFLRDIDIILSHNNDAIRSVKFSSSPQEELHQKGLAPMTMNIKFAPRYSEKVLSTHLEQRIQHVLKNDLSIRKHIDHSSFNQLQYTLTGSDHGGYTASIFTYGIIRHPAQLYESFSSLLIFFWLFFFWHKKGKKIINGELFGMFALVLFGLRFFYEFLKENQVNFEDDIALNMGQWLSIPMIILGLILLSRIYFFQKNIKAKH